MKENRLAVGITTASPNLRAPELWNGLSPKLVPEVRSDRAEAGESLRSFLCRFAQDCFNMTRHSLKAEATRVES
jgi:hypothetical protein